MSLTMCTILIRTCLLTYYTPRFFSGFVEFDDEYDAKDAVRDLDGKEICGQKVRIELSNVSFYFLKT